MGNQVGQRGAHGLQSCAFYVNARQMILSYSKTVEITSTLDVPALQKVLTGAGYPAEPV